MSNNSDLAALRERNVARGVANLHQIYVDRAENAEIWDVDGKRYIDLAAGIAVNNVGHRHPRVLAAVEAQLQRFTHSAFQIMPYDVYLRLAERLNRLAPGPTPKKTLFLTTGVEAVENAIKIARYHTGRSGVIAFAGGFHGRTLLGMALTGKVAPYKSGFGPLPGDIYHVPYPIEYHGINARDSLQALEALFKFDIEAARVAAIVVEPVQGEGGFYAAPPGFLGELRRLCDRHGILLIADEIQTGFGRTGTLFACEAAGVEPDLMTVAKSVGGGLPLSGVIGKAAIIDSVPPGGLGSTYGGPPLACAAGLAVLDIIEDEGLCERAVAIGARIHAWGTALRNEANCIGDVRATGAMAAIELVRDGEAEAPDAEITKEIVAASAAAGVLMLSCGIRGNVIRFLPPLTIADELLDEGLARAREVILGVHQRRRKAG
jgi:4-aminobutyrate aminotransferase/(S)-3-amino-2-methylpropionate transaminase